MLKKGIFIFLLLFWFCLNLTADSVDYTFGLGLDLVKPLRSFDFSEDIFGGLDIRWKITRFLGASFDFYYVKRAYYDYAAGWYGPQPFVNITATSSVGDWIFYHEEMVFAINAVFFFPMGNLQPYFATGPAWLLLAKSTAADYYPEFDQYFLDYKSNADFFIGYLARLGLECFIFDMFSLGTEFLFKVDRLGQFFDDLFNDPLTYIQGRSNLVITMRVWLF